MPMEGLRRVSGSRLFVPLAMLAVIAQFVGFCLFSDGSGPDSLVTNKVQTAMILLEALGILAINHVLSCRMVHGIERQLSQAKWASTRATHADAAEADLQAALRQIKDYESKLEKAIKDAASADEMTRCATHRFQELFMGLPVSCFTIDVSGTIFDWNRASSGLFGRRPETVYLQNAFAVLPAEDDRATLSDACAKVATGESVANLEWRAKSPDGSLVEISTDAFPIKTPAGEVTGILIACTDQTERKQAASLLGEQIRMIQDMNELLEVQKRELEYANLRLEALAATDGLTGLLNHRTFQQSFRGAFDSAQRSSKPLSIILLDVDKFKSFNDSFGHQAGDETLKTVGEALMSVAVGSDFVARYGGEEFVIVCPDRDAEDAMRLAELMRTTIESREWKHGPVTASFGVSTLSPDTANPEQMISEADQSLYACKEAGRNCVKHYSWLTRRAA